MQLTLTVSPKSETPLYEQLYKQIAAQILAHKIEAHYCLPSIRVVARELQISVIPVKAAYDKLETDGYIYTMPGKGCFVNEMHTVSRKSQLAEAKIRETVDYCRGIGLSNSEIRDIIDKLL